MNIYIIGMPLSGKTTTAKKLAEKLQFNHLDLDDYIEQTYNVKINDLFNSGNEKTFRQLETKALKTILKASNNIVSTGGGIVVDENNLNYMEGPIILLDVSMDILKLRQNKSYERPLLQKMKLKDLYKQRKNKYYKFADKIIKSSNLEEIIEQIIAFLKEKRYL